jgi:hypothetical protein
LEAVALVVQMAQEMLLVRLVTHLHSQQFQQLAAETVGLMPEQRQALSVLVDRVAVVAVEGHQIKAVGLVLLGREIMEELAAQLALLLVAGVVAGHQQLVRMD